ncbi:hypothetical protein VB779_17435 [Haloarculaceae archaeon H-GB11]|nr:hypothetical protein [Haloarculaceae archaeon H-GB11]
MASSSSARRWRVSSYPVHCARRLTVVRASSVRRSVDGSVSANQIVPYVSPATMTGAPT